MTREKTQDMTTNDADILVCDRISDTEPQVQSRVDACAQCGAALWRALSSPTRPQAWCCDCAHALFTNPPPGTKIVHLSPTAEQLADIERELADAEHRRRAREDE